MADIVVFNPETDREKSTFENPTQFPEGIPYVLVNGIIVVDDEKHSGAGAGKVLLKNE